MWQSNKINLFSVIFTYVERLISVGKEGKITDDYIIGEILGSGK